MKEQLEMPSTVVASAVQGQEMPQNLALTIAQAADERKGEDIVILKIGDISYLTDYFVIVTGFSKAQLRAISQSVEEKMQSLWQRLPIRTEGKTNGSWILQDYGEVIVHIMLPEDRDFYDLEAFWGHAERVEFQASQTLGD